MLKLQHLPLIALAATLSAPAHVSPDTVFPLTLLFPARVGNGWIEAHWMGDGNRFPFNSVTLAPGEQVARFVFEGRRYALHRRSNELREETASETDRLEPRLLSKAAVVGPPRVYEIPSPDGKWYLGGR